MLEVDARTRHQAVLAGQHSSPSPVAMLHQEMVCTRAQRRQATVDHIAHHTRVDAWKWAMRARMAC
jgi:hypothetical protein